MGYSISELPRSFTAQRLLQKMEHNAGDASLVVIGDSTGNEIAEWVYLLAQRIGALYPAYSVMYYLWDDTSKAYGSPVTVQTGTGANTLNVWNASVAGQNLYYPVMNGFIAQVVTPSPDLVIISHGHNEGALTLDLEKWNNRGRYILLGQYIASRVPGAAIALVAQNPSTASSVQKARAQMVAEVASMCGYGFVNVHDAFLAHSDWSTALMSDAVHPNAAGQQVWLNEVTKHFVYARSFQTPPQLVSSFTPVTNLLSNGDFGAFSAAVPDNWTASLAPTLSKDVANFETGTYGLKMVSAAASQGSIYQDVHTANAKTPLALFKGKWVTMAVRLRKPTGSPTSAGRLALNDGVSTITSRANYAGDGAFYWDIVTMKISDNATRVRAYIYSDSGTTGNVEITVDRAILAFGLLPRDMF